MRQAYSGVRKLWGFEVASLLAALLMVLMAIGYGWAYSSSAEGDLGLGCFHSCVVMSDSTVQ